MKILATSTTSLQQHGMWAHREIKKGVFDRRLTKLHPSPQNCLRKVYVVWLSLLKRFWDQRHGKALIKGWAVSQVSHYPDLPPHCHFSAQCHWNSLWNSNTKALCKGSEVMVLQQCHNDHALLECHLVEFRPQPLKWKTKLWSATVVFVCKDAEPDRQWQRLVAFQMPWQK